MSITRAQRRQLARDNAKQPTTFVEVPREDWPTNAFQPNRLRVWRSREYLVQEFYEPAPVLVRLSINRTSMTGERWQDGISWDELQRIKNEVGHAERDAVEIFPVAADVVNVANIRHLWVLRDKLPFAWRDEPSANELTPGREVAA